MIEKQILLVEDNPDDEELARLALQQCPIPNRVVVARDGVEALSLLEKPGETAGGGQIVLPDLILLDLKLPKVSGLEVLERIRANASISRIPVIVLTSSSEIDDIRNSYHHGANSYIRKPVSFLEFKKMMNILGAFWLEQNQTPRPSTTSEVSPSGE